jgi:hypothetical protein
MPAIIDSAPDCITHVSGAKPADDSADFILQAAYEKCGGIMTFGPGTTWGEDGASAATSYYVLTWIGIAVMVAVIAAWVLYEDRRLWSHVARIRGRSRGGPAAGVTEPPVTE